MKSRYENKAQQFILGMRKRYDQEDIMAPAQKKQDFPNNARLFAT